MGDRQPARYSKSISQVLRDKCREALYVPPTLWVQRRLDLLGCSFVLDPSVVPQPRHRSYTPPLRELLMEKHHIYFTPNYPTK